MLAQSLSFARHAVRGVAATFILVLPLAASAQRFQQTNLVSDDTSLNPAALQDSSLVNAWGMSSSATSPFWVSNNGTGTSTLYQVSPTTNAVTKLGLTVKIPMNGPVTGQVFNGSSQFHGDPFLFVGEDGGVSGWRGVLGSNAESLVAPSNANVYKGVAEEIIAGNAYLLAANFRTGNVDVIKGSGGAPSLTGSFTDSMLPAGYAPFDVADLGGTTYVSYAEQDPLKHDDVAGVHHGYVDAYDAQGNLLGRVASGGPLDSPWGMALAPASFGAFAGDLLVGNFGDGTINAYNLATDKFVGQLPGVNGNPLTIDGLWGLKVGNGGRGGSLNDLYFTAGPGGENHGLFGSLAPVPEFGSLWSFGGLAVAGALTLQRRKARKE